jgi:hypothetical protein
MGSEPARRAKRVRRRVRKWLGMAGLLGPPRLQAGMAGAGGLKRKGTGEGRTDTDWHGLTRRTLWYDVANG